MDQIVKFVQNLSLMINASIFRFPQMGLVADLAEVEYNVRNVKKAIIYYLLVRVLRKTI